MIAYRRILACIDDFDRDAKMLAYIANIVRLAGIEEVHLIYASEDLLRPSYSDYSSHVQSRLDSGIPPAPDMFDVQNERVEYLAQSAFGSLPGCAVKTHVVYGAPMHEALELSLTLDVDIIAMRQSFGELSEKGSKALAARRIARRAACSILTVPDDFVFETANILVPVRDSDCSQNAFVAACAIAEATGGMVEALNIYQVYSDYMFAGIPLGEHLADLEDRARQETRSLLDRTAFGNVEVRTHFMPDLNADPVGVIRRRAREMKANMFVIGARGRTGAAGILLGTVTEQLLQQAEMPVLAVKTKGESLGVVRTLLEMMGVEKLRNSEVSSTMNE